MTIIQQLLMKNSNSGYTRNISQYNKYFYAKYIANITLNGKRLKAFPLKQKKTRDAITPNTSNSHTLKVLLHNQIQQTLLKEEMQMF